MIKADQGVLGEIGHGIRRAGARQVALMGKHAELDPANSTGDEQLLPRLCHAYGDIGFAAQKILHPVGEHEFDNERRVRIAQSGNDRRKHLDANDVACRDPYRPAHARSLTRGNPLQSGSRAMHGFRITAQRQRCLGRHEAGL